MAFLGLSERKTRWVGFIIFCVILLALVSIIPSTFGFSKGGFSDTNVLQQFFFYPNVGIASLLIIVGLTIANGFLTKGDSQYGDGLGFYSPGERPHILGNAFKKPFRLFLGCVLIFGVLGLFAGVTKQTYFGVGTLQQGFTKVDNVIYSGSLISTAENLGAAASL